MKGASFIFNKYNVWLIIPIFMFCYFYIQKISALIKRNAYESKFGIKPEKKPSVNLLIKKLLGKKIFLIAEKRLYKQGYPLGLNGVRYYFFKLLLFIVCFIMGMKNYELILMGFLLGMLGYFSIDFFIYTNKIIRNNAIKNDLLNVVDCLCLQMSAGMSLQDALRGLHEICENRSLKMAMVRLSTEYDLSEHNIEEATDQLKESFDLIEVELFTSALKQQVYMGSAQEVLKNLSEILKEGYLDRLNLKTKMKMLYIVAGVIIIMIDIIALTMFPIFVDVGAGMKKIFE